MRYSLTPSLARIALTFTILALWLPQPSGAQALAPAVALRPGASLPRIQAAARAANSRIAGQIVAGSLAAATLGFVAWKALDDPEGSDRRVKGDAGYTPNANTAFAIGSFVGSAVVTYLVGRGDGSRASFGATAVGAAIASIPLALGRDEPYLPIIGIVLGAPLQAIGGTIGYQLTRREP